MKNILSKLGTKKVAGIVLVGATLVVGFGVVNNFSGGSQKAANEAALSRFEDNYYNVFTGGRSASRADLERQISAGQDKYTARFLKGKSEGTDDSDAFSSDGAYAEGVRSDEGFVYGPESSYGGNGVNGVGGNEYNINAYSNGDAYNPFGSTYEESIELRGKANNSGSVNGAQSVEDAAAASAGKAAKGKKGKGAKSAKDKGDNATQINKLQASKGGSSFNKGGGTSGGAMGGGDMSSGSARRNDSSARNLPQVNAQAGTADSNAFKFGRAGGMGGFNVGVNGRGVNGNGGETKGALNDALKARYYSGKGTKTSYSAGKKSSVESAFDGSGTETDREIDDNATIEKVVNDLLDEPDMPDLKPLKPVILDIQSQLNGLSNLQKKTNNMIWGMIAATVISAIALGFLVQQAYAFPAAWWWWVAAAAASAVALAAIACFMWAGDGSIVRMIRQMGDNDKFGLVNQSIDVGKNLRDAGLIAGGCVLALGLMWIPWKNIINSIKFALRKPLEAIPRLIPKVASLLSPK